jgi:hypothetical protein
MSVSDDATETDDDAEWQFSEWQPGEPGAGGGLLSQILSAVHEARAETQALRNELAATNQRIDRAVAQLTEQIESLVAEEEEVDEDEVEEHESEVAKLSDELAELRRILIGS